jgi:lipopolysaccharide export system protein LptA
MNKAALCLFAAGLAAAAPLGQAKEAKAPPSQPAAAAPGDDIGLARGSGQLEVTADNGLEFVKDAKEVIARVNAKAVRGNTTMTADVMTAYFRTKKPAAGSKDQPPFKDKPPPAPAAPSTAAAPQAKPENKGEPKPAADAEGGSDEVWRVTSDGNVEIFTPTQHAYGDHADYNVDDSVVVLTGDHLKMTTPRDIVTARDTLEYWENRHQAVARGNAVATSGEKRIQADILVADFAENKQKQMAIQVAHGYDHVIVTTPTEVVTGDRADYTVETGIVTVTGSVKMTRENNQLNGGYAVVNLNTGISRLFPAPPGGKTEQVKGLFVPSPKKSPASAPSDTAPKVP